MTDTQRVHVSGWFKYIRLLRTSWDGFRHVLCYSSVVEMRDGARYIGETKATPIDVLEYGDELDDLMTICPIIDIEPPSQLRFFVGDLESMPVTSAPQSDLLLFGSGEVPARWLS